MKNWCKIKTIGSFSKNQISNIHTKSWWHYSFKNDFFLWCWPYFTVVHCTVDYKTTWTRGGILTWSGCEPDRRVMLTTHNIPIVYFRSCSTKMVWPFLRPKWMHMWLYVRHSTFWHPPPPHPDPEFPSYLNQNIPVSRFVRNQVFSFKKT